MMRKNLMIALLSVLAMGCSKESELSELDSIQLDKNSLTLQIGATYQFKVTNKSKKRNNRITSGQQITPTSYP